MAIILNNIISVRVPAEWRGCITSEQVRGWVLDYLNDPVAFDEVPPPGPYRLNFRLSQGEFAALLRLNGRSVSANVRGIVALNMDVAPQGTGRNWFFTVCFVLLTLIVRFRACVRHGAENS